MYFLNINKPKGLTSFDVIHKLRKKLNIKQIGHSGTLDPMATGVLQIGVGSATKLLDYLPSDKTYIAKLKLGYVTDTYDSEGLEQFIKAPNISKEELTKCLKSFEGKSVQNPPKYSAVKINGKKLCDLARKNIEVAINPREIEIYSVELIDFNGYDLATIKVSSKKGVYIRSLVNDLGLKLTCGAYLTELTRTQAGNFKIENSNNLDDEKFIEINPITALNMQSIELSQDELNKILNGNFIQNKTGFNRCKILLTFNKKLVSVAEISDNLIKPKKNFKGV